MDITHDNVCSSMLSCFYSHLLSTGRPISSYYFVQSEDIRLLRQELEQGISDLEKISQLREECAALSWKKEEWVAKCSRFV